MRTDIRTLRTSHEPVDDLPSRDTSVSPNGEHHVDSGSPDQLRRSSEKRAKTLRQKRICFLKRKLHDLNAELEARLTNRSKTETYALVAGIDAHKMLLKLVYNEETC